MKSKRELAAKEVDLEGRREQQLRYFSRLPELIELHISNGRFIQAVGHIGELGSGSMLSVAMMDWTIEDEAAAARRHLELAASFIPRLGEPTLPGGSGPQARPLIDLAVEAFGPLQGNGRVAATAHMRDGPFCLLVAAVLTNTLRKHLPLLSRLAPLIREHNSEDYSSLDALGLLAAATGDVALRDAFSYRVESYLKEKWLQSFFHSNMRQIQALLARDQTALDTTTEQAASEFLQRAKDKKTLGQRLGLGMYSHVEFDLLGVTVGKLARLNGLRFEHDSRAIPLGIITMFE
ncbi:MAG: hypothetical protein ACK56N_00380 [Betaproteobacteria bacterium]